MSDYTGPHLLVNIPFTPERIEKVAEKMGIDPEDVTALDLECYVIMILDEAEK